MPIDATSPTTSATIATHHSLISAGPRWARFQDRNGPTAMAKNTGQANGNTVASKNGGPTEIFCPSNRSASSGYSVPVTTTAAIEHKRMLFSTMPPSRDTGANRPDAPSFGARMA